MTGSDAEDIKRDHRKDPFIWTNLEFCELDIDPASKAVYLEIVRRGRNSDRGCDESVENIAHWANVSATVAKRSLKKLIEWRMIVRVQRKGFTSAYHLLDSRQWIAPKLQAPTPKKDRSKTPKDEDNLDQIQPSPNLTQVKNDLRGGPNLTQGGGPNLTHELDPSELDPLTRSQGGDQCGSRLNGAIDVERSKASEPVAEILSFPTVKKEEIATTQIPLLDDVYSAPPKKSSQKNKFTEDDFEDLWAVNLNKKGKGYARKAFFKLSPSVVTLEELKRTLSAQQSEYLRSRPDDGRSFTYFPHLSSWLNGERWADVSTPAQKTKPVQAYYEAPIESPTVASIEEKRAAWESVKAQMPKTLLKKMEAR